MTEIVSTSERQTLNIARDLARSTKLPTHILLFGDLGAGKTLFSKGLAEAYGIDPNDVTSPTFTLINQYKTKNATIYHIDLYRIETGALNGLGLEDIFDDPNAVVIIEWAERLGHFETPGATQVFLSYVDEHSRKIRICPSS